MDLHDIFVTVDMGDVPGRGAARVFALADRTQAIVGPYTYTSKGPTGVRYSTIVAEAAAFLGLQDPLWQNRAMLDFHSKEGQYAQDAALAAGGGVNAPSPAFTPAADHFDTPGEA